MIIGLPIGQTGQLPSQSKGNGQADVISSTETHSATVATH